ncbi:pre-mRNA 3'-end-processing factor fip1 [Anaeramoeba flamelloides]|uniref:Pre-mRNA 3'-end-processing factor fip1 n=1 Tax=Anaeramoeba flamelloides TaxID=1746091 RepID=A0AAV7YKC4_9EUKA|nr:pre-mRNA 3'-end-processing factor fip1 [Anaeramoeba flamelloides]
MSQLPTVMQPIKEKIEKHFSNRAKIKTKSINSLQQLSLAHYLFQIRSHFQEAFEDESMTISSIVGSENGYVTLLSFLNIFAPPQEIKVKKTELNKVQLAENVSTFKEVLFQIYRFPQKEMFLVNRLIKNNYQMTIKFIESIFWLIGKIKKNGIIKDDQNKSRKIQLKGKVKKYSTLKVGELIKKKVYKNPYWHDLLIDPQEQFKNLSNENPNIELTLQQFSQELIQLDSQQELNEDEMENEIQILFEQCALKISDNEILDYTKKICQKSVLDCDDNNGDEKKDIDSFSSSKSSKSSNFSDFSNVSNFSESDNEQKHSNKEKNIVSESETFPISNLMSSNSDLDLDLTSEEKEDQKENDKNQEKELEKEKEKEREKENENEKENKRGKGKEDSDSVSSSSKKKNRKNKKQKKKPNRKKEKNKKQNAQLKRLQRILRKEKEQIETLEKLIKKKKKLIRSQNYEIDTFKKKKNQKNQKKKEIIKTRNVNKQKQQGLSLVDPKIDSCLHSQKVMPSLLKYSKNEKYLLENFFILNVFNRWKLIDIALLEPSYQEFIKTNKKPYEICFENAIRYARLGSVSLPIRCWDLENAQKSSALIKIDKKRFEIVFAYNINGNNGNDYNNHKRGGLRSAMKSKWDPKTFTIYLHKQKNSKLVTFVNHKNEKAILIATPSLEIKYIIIFLFLIFNQSNGKDKSIGYNPRVRYIDPQMVNTAVLPNNIKPKRRLREHLVSYNKMFNPNNQYIANRKPQEERKTLHTALKAYWKRRAVNFLCSVMVNREFPFLAGFIRVRKTGITVGIGNTVMKKFMFDSEFKIEQVESDDKLIHIKGKKYFLGKLSFLKKKKNLSNFEIDDTLIAANSSQDRNLIITFISYFFEGKRLGNAGGNPDQKVDSTDSSSSQEQLFLNPSHDDDEDVDDSNSLFSSSDENENENQKGKGKGKKKEKERGKGEEKEKPIVSSILIQNEMQSKSNSEKSSNSDNVTLSSDSSKSSKSESESNSENEKEREKVMIMVKEKESESENKSENKQSNNSTSDLTSSNYDDDNLDIPPITDSYSESDNDNSESNQEKENKSKSGKSSKSSKSESESNSENEKKSEKENESEKESESEKQSVSDNKQSENKDNEKNSTSDSTSSNYDDDSFDLSPITDSYSELDNDNSEKNQEKEKKNDNLQADLIENISSNSSKSSKSESEKESENEKESESKKKKESDLSFSDFSVTDSFPNAEKESNGKSGKESKKDRSHSEGSSGSGITFDRSESGSDFKIVSDLEDNDQNKKQNSDYNQQEEMEQLNLDSDSDSNSDSFPDSSSGKENKKSKSNDGKSSDNSSLDLNSGREDQTDELSENVQSFNSDMIEDFENEDDIDQIWSDSDSD